MQEKKIASTRSNSQNNVIRERLYNEKPVKIDGRKRKKTHDLC